MELGAGRKKKEDVIDPSAGIILKKKTGDPIREGDPLAVLYSSSGDLCAAAERTFLGAIAIRPEKPEPRPLLIARVDKDGFQKL
jgi:pyrimidine-nucleoside phosphorylase